MSTHPLKTAALLLLSTGLVRGGEAPVDFDNEVIPVLTKAGCNTGACHGAAVGRGGFRLSLYGGDPDSDYQTIVLELEGRRINPAQPDESLVVLKPTESVSHEGGTRLEYEGEGANLLTKWVRQGAPRVHSKRLQELHVSPQSHVAEQVDSTLQLRAVAKFDDDSEVDVTHWTVFTAEDPSAVAVDPKTAVATMLRRGRHIVVARYLDRVVPLELILPLSDTPVDLTAAPRQNFVDDEVLQLLSTLRIPLSPQVDDATFLRRATLDLSGRLPTLEAVQDFRNDPSPQKRRQLIDRLLRSDEFSEYWTMRLAALLRIRSSAGGETEAALTFHNWLREQLAGAVPWDEMARQMLTSTGDTHVVGPANFYRSVSGPREQAEFASELFMGSRLRCANCHNHPLDRWTQDDYHGLSAIFAKLERGQVIRVSTRGEVTHPRTGEAAVERIPGERFLDGEDDGRKAFASWLTDRSNPYFAKATVNRLWKALMGRGLVEPSDDFRDTNPATHPRLLEQLAEDFIDHGYDIRHTLRTIALSATYARSATTLPDNSADDRFYSHAIVRPLGPEVLADAITDVLNVPEQYGDQPLGTRAVALFDSNIPSESLDILGRCSREDTCETAAAATGGLPQTLHMFNGELINRRVADPQSRLTSLIAAGRERLEIVDEMYERALGRLPSERERKFWNEQISAATDDAERQTILEDFVWSLVTCREFVTNH